LTPGGTEGFRQNFFCELPRVSLGLPLKPGEVKADFWRENVAPRKKILKLFLAFYPEAPVL
jgi:hypothetical protein